MNKNNDDLEFKQKETQNTHELTVSFWNILDYLAHIKTSIITMENITQNQKITQSSLVFTTFNEKTSSDNQTKTQNILFSRETKKDNVPASSLESLIKEIPKDIFDEMMNKYDASESEILKLSQEFYEGITKPPEKIDKKIGEIIQEKENKPFECSINEGISNKTTQISMDTEDVVIIRKLKSNLKQEPKKNYSPIMFLGNILSYLKKIFSIKNNTIISYLEKSIIKIPRMVGLLLTAIFVYSSILSLLLSDVVYIKSNGTFAKNTNIKKFLVAKTDSNENVIDTKKDNNLPTQKKQIASTQPFCISNEANFELATPIIVKKDREVNVPVKADFNPAKGDAALSGQAFIRIVEAKGSSTGSSVTVTNTRDTNINAASSLVIAVRGNVDATGANGQTTRSLTVSIASLGNYLTTGFTAYTYPGDLETADANNSNNATCVLDTAGNTSGNVGQLVSGWHYQKAGSVTPAGIIYVSAGNTGFAAAGSKLLAK